MIIKEALSSIIIKAVSYIVSMLLVSNIQIKYNLSGLGIYSLYLGIITIIGGFDFGLKNTLKNYVNSNKLLPCEQIRMYEKINLFLCTISLVLFYILKVILNYGDMPTIVVILIPFVFIFSSANNIFINMNKSYWSSFILLISQIITLFVVLYAEYFDVYEIILSNILSTIVVNLFAILFIRVLYRNTNTNANIKIINSSLKNVIIGNKFVLLNFFFLQLSVLLLYTIDKFIIVEISNYEVLGQYEIVYRYLYVFLMISITLLTPYWPKLTKTIGHNKMLIKKIALINLSFIFPLSIFVIINDWYEFLFSLENVPTTLYALYGIFVYLTILQNFVSYTLNAYNILKKQVYIAFISIVVKFSLIYIFNVENLKQLILINILMACIAILFLFKEFKVTYDKNN